MVIVGIILTVNINAAMPTGQTGMSEEEIIDLLIAQQETRDYNTLSGNSNWNWVLTSVD